ISLLCQNYDSRYISAEPMEGWDSLKARIPYSELYRRAGFWSIYMFDFSFDSLGNVEGFEPTKYLHFDGELETKELKVFGQSDSVFVIRIENILRSFKWKQVVYDSKTVKGRVKLPIMFNQFGFSKWYGVLINIPHPIVNVSH
nr:hypothetical protein [Bacteroidota bacterium]